MGYHTTRVVDVLTLDTHQPLSFGLSVMKYWIYGNPYIDDITLGSGINAKRLINQG